MPLSSHLVLNEWFLESASVLICGLLLKLCEVCHWTNWRIDPSEVGHLPQVDSRRETLAPPCSRRNFPPKPDAFAIPLCPKLPPLQQRWVCRRQTKTIGIDDGQRRAGYLPDVSRCVGNHPGRPQHAKDMLFCRSVAKTAELTNFLKEGHPPQTQQMVQLEPKLRRAMFVLECAEAGIELSFQPWQQVRGSRRCSAETRIGWVGAHAREPGWKSEYEKAIFAIERVSRRRSQAGVSFDVKQAPPNDSHHCAVYPSNLVLVRGIRAWYEKSSGSFAEFGTSCLCLAKRKALEGDSWCADIKVSWTCSVAWQGRVCWIQRRYANQSLWSLWPSASKAGLVYEQGFRPSWLLCRVAVWRATWECTGLVSNECFSFWSNRDDSCVYCPTYFYLENPKQVFAN